MTPPVVILAGGEGRRIGGGKPLRLLDGRSLLDHALSAAQAWSDRIAAGVRDPAQAGRADVTLIADVPDIPGPLAGLAAALDWAAAQGAGRVLVAPCDMPFLPADLARRLADGLTPQAGAVIAASGGRLHPVCGLWRTSVRPLLDDQARAGRLSLTALAGRAGAVIVDWPAAPDDPFANVNTPADLARAEARLRADDQAGRRPADEQAGATP